MCTLPIAAPAVSGAAGVTFVDMFSCGGGDESGSAVKRLQALYDVVERFVCDAADAANAADAADASSASCCFIIDGIHELLMCALPSSFHAKV
jgi:hypothetical protein